MKTLAAIIAFALPLATDACLAFNGIGPIQLSEAAPPELNQIIESRSSKTHGIIGYTLKREEPFSKFGPFGCTVMFWEKKGRIFSIKWLIDIGDPSQPEFREAFQAVTGLILNDSNEIREGRKMLSVFTNGKRTEVTLHLFKNENGA